jgi:bifunctional DNA-binding transcriptional regulator/antitoxin component of YhaV-PrlF toxin-antitoxin module
MTGVVTKDGQLPLPHELCEELGLAPGQALEIRSEGGAVGGVEDNGTRSV